MFDTSYEDHIVQKALGGFNLCALISAHYGLSDVFDNLVVRISSSSSSSLLLRAAPLQTLALMRRSND